MQFDNFNTNKVLYHHGTMGKIAQGFSCYPVMISIDASSMCNQKCVWCSGTGYVNNTRAYLDQAILQRLPSEATRMGVSAVLFSGGGEPLLNENVPSAAVDFASRGIEVGLITNGTKLSTKNIGILARNCKFIRISIDAAQAETYSELHGGSTTLREIQESVKELVSQPNRCEVGVSFIVHKKNRWEICEFAHTYHEIGVDYVQFKPVVSDDDWLDDKYIYNDIIRNLEQNRRIYDGPKFRVLSNFKRFRHVKSNYIRLYGECLGHHLIGQVLATGQLCVCCQLRPVPELHFGNLLHKSFLEVWNSNERREVAKRIDLEKCPTCKFEAYNQMLWTMRYPPDHVNFL